MNILCGFTILLGISGMLSSTPLPFEKDVISSTQGKVAITFITHGTLLLVGGGTAVYFDPISRGGIDYSLLPKADIILVTHEHGDHLEPAAIAAVSKAGTELIYTEACAAKVPGGTVMKNGEKRTVRGIQVEALPAYNIVNMRSPGLPYHPRGSGNGYLLAIAGLRVYVAGDSENTPEMKALKNIDVAFLPMNLPYTMTPEMVADAARSFRPKILYPYHYGDTDPQQLKELLQSEKGIEVRIRAMR